MIMAQSFCGDHFQKECKTMSKVKNNVILPHGEQESVFGAKVVYTLSGYLLQRAHLGYVELEE